jgi:UDP-glucose 4-epimerase
VKVLVTGGAGFIGSHLVDALLAADDQVLVIDDLSSGSRDNLAAALDAGAELAVGDVRDASLTNEQHAGFRPDVVVHLAAQVDVRKAVADPALDAEINVLGTVNVLEAARLAGGAPVVFASTGGAIYGEGAARQLPFAEDAELRPETAYGTSKLSGEAYLDLYRRLHGQEGAVLRLGNVYGPRQDPHGEAGVVAIFCGRLLAGQAPLIYGDGEQTRDYVYVTDVVAAMRAAISKLASGSALSGLYNVGTGIETSVLDLARHLAEASGIALTPEHAPPRKGEISRVSIDPAAAGRDLGWSPRVDLAAGLAATYRSVDTREG